MKSFFKYVFASALGFVLGTILLFGFLALILSAVVASFGNEGEITIKDGTVLVVELAPIAGERTSKNPFEQFSPGGLRPAALGLNDILKNLDKARRDSRIKGILLNLTTIPAGRATNEEIRKALLDFKQSGKFIYAYGDYYTQGAYYLATTADRIYVHPQGMVDFKGLSMEMMFLKGALEKLEIEPQIIRHGKYKSAIEPFILDKMSPENREQLRTLMGDMWNHMLTRISESRKIPVDTLRMLADGFVSRDPEAALKNRLVDRVAFYDELLTDLEKSCSWKKEEKPKTVSLQRYDKAFVKSDRPYSGRKIAVIYAVGEISEGEGNDNSIGSVTTAEEIRKARLDTAVKAVVLRVNSPGGSALASDVIWREVMLTRKAKPVVASMGDVAASGGYYISCAADSIIAQPTTITGSIGVFGLMFNAQKMLNNKLGITFDTLKTSRFADLGSMTRPMRADERAMIEQEIEHIYDVFTGRVAEGRRMSKSGVDSIGQGRVWSGATAVDIGLVDRLGTLEDAVKMAARLAKLDTYRIVELPRQKEFIEQLMEDFASEAEAFFAKNELGEENYRYYSGIRQLVRQQGVIAKMPFELDIH
ncbi:MAG: signal peptide peptidase SppA [Bacteroidota bacterium]|jgi:protease-4